MASRSDRPRRSILIVDEPEELRSVAVAIDRCVVLLPPPFPPRDIYDRLAALSPADLEAIALRGKAFDWPAGPQFALDFLHANAVGGADGAT